MPLREVDGGEGGRHGRRQQRCWHSAPCPHDGLNEAAAAAARQEVLGRLASSSVLAASQALTHKSILISSSRPLHAPPTTQGRAPRFACASLAPSFTPPPSSASGARTFSQVRQTHTPSSCWLGRRSVWRPPVCVRLREPAWEVPVRSSKCGSDVELKEEGKGMR